MKNLKTIEMTLEEFRELLAKLNVDWHVKVYDASGHTTPLKPFLYYRFEDNKGTSEEVRLFMQRRGSKTMDEFYRTNKFGQAIFENAWQYWIDVLIGENLLEIADFYVIRTIP